MVDMARSISRRSLEVNSTWTAPIFSSRLLFPRVRFCIVSVALFLIQVVAGAPGWVKMAVPNSLKRIALVHSPWLLAP